MNKPSLSQVFGASTEANAAIAAFLRDMEPVSAQLARDLAGAHDTLAHSRGHATGRQAHGARRREAGWQWGALAACLIAGVALWAARGTVSPLSSESALAQSPLREDRIFTWATRQVAAEPSKSDAIFRVNDGSDQIFDGRFGHRGG
jgi:hypothetical protein